MNGLQRSHLKTKGATMIPFLDLGAAYRELKPEIDDAVQRVLSSGWYILGPEVEAFEREWAAYCGSAHCVSVANGLDALELALKALGVGEGDEVIVPSNTYIATWLAVSALGARPIPVEPNPNTHLVTADAIGQKITPRTRVILPVHLYGQPADMGSIVELAKSKSLYVVEDAAQAHGAKYQGKRIGSHGDIVCWSFYPGKNLGAYGDGGAVTTSNDELADRIAVMRNYGSRQKYFNEVKGVNSRLDPLHAAVLRVKIPHLDGWNRRRAQIANLYSTELKGLPLILPVTEMTSESAWHLYVIRTAQRSRLQDALSKAGVGTLIHYPVPPHMQTAYRNLGFSESSLPIARQLAKEVLSLPIGPHLSVDEAHAVCCIVRETVTDSS